MSRGNSSSDRRVRRTRKRSRITRRRVLGVAGAGLFTTGVGTGAPSTTRSENLKDDPTEPTAQGTFVGRKGTDFVHEGETFYPVGGNHPQLRKQSAAAQTAWLDQWLGKVPALNVLRATAFGTGTKNTTLPLQPSPGKHNEEAFRRLDRLIAKCGERGVRLILPLTNYWPWQGGIPQYVAWSDTASQKNDFYTDEQAQEWYRNHIETVLTRENTITGVQYKDDPTIMMWELANEPEGGEAFLEWVKQTSGYIHSIDSNHLVSTGAAMTTDLELFEKAHRFDSIDACSLHIWADAKHTGIGFDGGSDVINAQTETAHDLGKPIYSGEFGWPVDRTDDTPDATEIEERNNVFAGWFVKMREVGMDGALVWDLRHNEEYPLDWNQYAVFPRDQGTPSIIKNAYANFGSPLPDRRIATKPPSLSVETHPPAELGLDRKQLTVPRGPREITDEPVFTLQPTGETITDPDGTANTKGTSDLSADVYLRYDADNLYLRVSVTDDIHQSKSGSSLWQLDSLQWAVGHNGAYGPEYGLSHHDGNPSLVRWLDGSAKKEQSAVKVTTNRTETTTTYDVTMPWLSLFSTKKQPGDTFPFSLIINENDSDDNTRDAVLGWTLPGINGKKKASALGLLILDSADSVPWRATMRSSPSSISVGERGDWTFVLSNYGDTPQQFEITTGGMTKTIEVPTCKVALVTLEQAFATVGSNETTIWITNKQTGEKRTLAEETVVTPQGP
jgi:mannan endo-1,4-beta-mannosidase